MSLGVDEGTVEGVFWVAEVAGVEGVSSVTGESSGVVAEFLMFCGISFFFLWVIKIQSFLAVC